MNTLSLDMRGSRMHKAGGRHAGSLLPASPAEAASLVGGMAREGFGSRRGPKGGCCMCRPRHWRAGQLALACLGLAMALDHVPQCHQVQRMQHLVPPLSLPLHSCAFMSLAWDTEACPSQATCTILGTAHQVTAGSLALAPSAECTGDMQRILLYQAGCSQLNTPGAAWTETSVGEALG